MGPAHVQRAAAGVCGRPGDRRRLVGIVRMGIVVRLLEMPEHREIVRMGIVVRLVGIVRPGIVVRLLEMPEHREIARPVRALTEVGLQGPAQPPAVAPVAADSARAPDAIRAKQVFRTKVEVVVVRRGRSTRMTAADVSLRAVLPSRYQPPSNAQLKFANVVALARSGCRLRLRPGSETSG